MCKYCEYDYPLLQITDRNSLINLDIYKNNVLRACINSQAMIDGNARQLAIRAKMPIKYCPMCGRKLSEEQ